MVIQLVLIPLFLLSVLLYGVYKVWYAFNYAKRNVHGRTVLITGGAAGLGRLQADRFAKLGAKLILWDANEELLAQAKEELSATTRVEVAKVDVSDFAQITQAAEAAGPVDYLINNAGISHLQQVHLATDAQIQKLLSINTLSHFVAIRSFLPGMIERKFGHITCIASAAGHVGIQWLSEYCVSKHALIGLMESLRFELLADQRPITTTTICPLFVDTPLVTAEAVADRIVEATVRGEEMVFIPESVSIVLPLIRLLPMKLQMKLLGPKAFGVLNKFV
jgi:NAD(P)-dependent dehydrogenase (short-subunit alcohol dehydrogenase family)